MKKTLILLALFCWAPFNLHFSILNTLSAQDTLWVRYDDRFNVSFNDMSGKPAIKQ